MEANVMTDMQFKTILDMIDMILDGCGDLEEARRKVRRLRGEKEKEDEERKERE